MAETIAVVDYGSGNLRSAAKALERAAADASLPDRIEITSDPSAVRTADRIVLPGVGAFADCMAGLTAVPGLKDALTEAVIERQRPFLGICVGMQLMADAGVEFGRHEGLGWIAGEVTRLTPADPALKIPHMGWNRLDIVRPHPVLTGLDDPFVYYVHSFAIRPARPGDLIATTDYGGAFAGVVGRDNLIGTQFHPEKSQAAGLTLLANFLNWRP
jgi:glutamine amidotransferase